MTHVIAQPCINVKDKACVDVCPVDCIHSKDSDPQFFINPNDCIDCTLCVDACPVSAIYAEEDLPAEWKHFTQVNKDYYKQEHVAHPAVDQSRDSRQIRVTGIGAAGQERLRAASVLIVGIGALGSHAADSLARAGTGRLWLCDRDVVDLSNLQRQVLFDEADARAGTPKAIAAAARLRQVNSQCELTPLVADCTRDLLASLPAVPDLILDGTDNFPTRYLLNDYAAQQHRPWIYAGAVGTEGTAMVIRPGGPCLRCLWPEPPPAGLVGTCDTAGILAPTIAAVTAFQVAEAIKLLTGAGEATRGVFTCDVFRGSYQVLGAASESAPDCPVCQGRGFPALTEGPPVAVTLCGRDAVQIDPPNRQPLDLDLLARALRGTATGVERTAHLLRFQADGCRFSVFPGGRTLVFGTQDPLRARALYDRWIGA